MDLTPNEKETIADFITSRFRGEHIEEISDFLESQVEESEQELRDALSDPAVLAVWLDEKTVSESGRSIAPVEGDVSEDQVREALDIELLQQAARAYNENAGIVAQAINIGLEDGNLDIGVQFA